MARPKSKKPKAIDLFSGCGGLTLGLRQAGFEVVAAVDAEPLAVSTYRMNHPNTHMVEGDIRSVSPLQLMHALKLKEGELALLAGCPPCQGFSSLKTLNGRKSIADPMNELIFEFIRFIDVFKPKTIMIENVPALASDPRIQQFGIALRERNYHYRSAVFDAADFGVPQRRKRMILIAAQARMPDFAAPDDEPATVSSAIKHLPRPALSGDPAHNYPVTRAPHVKSLIRRIPLDGGSRSALGESAQLPCHRKVKGFTDVYGRMAWSQPSPTITSGCINPSKGRFLHPRQHRAITLREAALLQGLPETYKLDLSRGRYPAALMIGNAFPPNFAERHARDLHAIATSQAT